MHGNTKLKFNVHCGIYKKTQCTHTPQWEIRMQSPTTFLRLNSLPPTSGSHKQPFLQVPYHILTASPVPQHESYLPYHFSSLINLTITNSMAQSFLRIYEIPSFSRNSPHFMKPEGSLSHSQEPTTFTRTLIIW